MEDGVEPNAHPQMTGTSANDGTTGPPGSDVASQTGQQYYIATQPAQDRQHIAASAGTSHLDMSGVAAALPTYTYGQMPQPMYQQHYVQQARNPQMSYPYPSNQYSGTMAGNYSVPYATQIHPQNFQQPRLYAPYQVNTGAGAGQQVFHNQAYFPQQPAIPLSVQSSFPSGPQTQPFGHMPASNYAPHVTGHYRAGQPHPESFGSASAGNQVYFSGETRKSSTSSLKIPSALRGPPRKPKQSGHALWVGNLPPGTNIIDLKDHFSKEATDDIESVFLISKSNCAFVNYKSEQSCAAAMSRFHDSRFNGVRLVCRLRRGSSPTTLTLPAGLSGAVSADSKTEAMPSKPQTEDKKEEAEENIKRQEKLKERYFIIKSLTIEDLERSVLSGIWATQSHNEESLNQAYQTAENVYLVFSANKSGEYFGYARMDSAIDNESAVSVDAPSAEAQKPQPISSAAAAELPLTIPTPATATAPKGYIIDDSARGTIFWEAESTVAQSESIADTSPANTDSGNVSGEETAEQSLRSPTNPDSPGPSTTYGKPFKITWLSTDRLPFYRTRGLRNPWNTNREVKIARDGTELEPSVGRKLVSMFNPIVVSGRLQQGQYTEMVSPLPGQGPAYRPY